MKIVGRRRSIDDQGVRVDLVYADSEAGRVRYHGADVIGKVVAKGGAGDCGGVSSDGRTIGIVEDVVANRDVGVVVPKHDLASFPVRVSERERVVCHQPVAGSIRCLNRETSVHVVEDVVDYGHVLALRINPMVKVQKGLAVRPTNVMKRIAVKDEVVFRRVQIDSIAANLVNDGMIGDVSDFVPSNGDVVSRALGLDA